MPNSRADHDEVSTRAIQINPAGMPIDAANQKHKAPLQDGDSTLEVGITMSVIETMEHAVWKGVEVAMTPSVGGSSVSGSVCGSICGSSVGGSDVGKWKFVKQTVDKAVMDAINLLDDNDSDEDDDEDDGGHFSRSAAHKRSTGQELPPVDFSSRSPSKGTRYDDTLQQASDQYARHEVRSTMIQTIPIESHLPSATIDSKANGWRSAEPTGGSQSENISGRDSHDSYLSEQELLRQFYVQDLLILAQNQAGSAQNGDANSDESYELLFF